MSRFMMFFKKYLPLLLSAILIFSPTISFASSPITELGELSSSKKKDLVFSGRLYIGDQSLGIIIKLKRSRKKIWSGTMDSPDQGTYDIPLRDVVVEKNRLHFENSEMEVSFDGDLQGNSIVGNFTLSSKVYPLTLERGEEGYMIKRPQTPSAPFPYTIKNVSIPQTFSDFQIGGTITIPPKKVKSKGTVILISGSGAQDRDETSNYHKPFAVLTDFLTRNGYTVLRCDDRGVGKSGGNFVNATVPDFAEDVDCEVTFMKKKFKPKSKKIYLIGFREGGMVAPLVARVGRNIDGMILLSTPSVIGKEVVISQMGAIKESINDVPMTQQKIEALHELFNLVVSSKSKDISEEIRSFCEQNYSRLLSREELNEVGKERLINLWTSQLSNPWMRFYLGYDPGIAINVSSDTKGQTLPPVLAIYGALDKQVLPSVNEPVMKRLLKAPNPKYNVITLPGLNHYLQKATSGSPLEYVRIEETINPEVLRIILEWLNRQR